LAQRWHALSQAVSIFDAALVLGAFDMTAGTRAVWMSVSSVDRDGERWVGEIDTSFLFGELNSEANGVRICVFQSTGGTVFCPGSRGGEAATLIDAEPPSGTRWSLFLRSDFGIEDWVLVDIGGSKEAAAGQAPMARLSALGAAVTLLLVGMLGLIQVRRTMVPLERLIAGTRRLAERDYSARVPALGGDEFGELARSFNHMAEQIGAQERRLLERATSDSLTGLANRAGLYASLVGGATRG
jgi:methyl-accepting chemotaxis protein